ncbi:MAG: tRNA-dihydrouridine synthase family protein [Spirochaetes bacterium]|nr:tRNA-dihydrouridine synthase family protein [Spirochaetota bacterium]
MTAIYLAPIQGITDRTYRTIFSSHFSGISKMFTPFEQADIEKKHRSFPLQKILPPEINGIEVVPQLISSNPESFIETANFLFEEGFKEINLNMGCPSPTVANKGRGSGMLQNPSIPEKFFSEISGRLNKPLSLKIRSGIRYHDELIEMSAVYNKFRFSEIIVHPRTLEQKYEGVADTGIFCRFITISSNPLIFNGDICSIEDYNHVINITDAPGVMIGRGILRNPFLAEEIAGGKEINHSEKLTRLKNFIDDMSEAYSSRLSGDSHYLDKMKELWLYQSGIFKDGKKFFKKLRKVHSKKNFLCMINEIFSSCPEIENSFQRTNQNQYPELQ